MRKKKRMEAKTEKDKMIHPAGYVYRCIVCMRVIWCAFNIKLHNINWRISLYQNQKKKKNVEEEKIVIHYTHFIFLTLIIQSLLKGV